MIVKCRWIIDSRPRSRNCTKKVGVISGRYAIARYWITTQGKPGHAGAQLKDGRSAITQMAKDILKIQHLTKADCTFSVGVVSPGQWVNCVPTKAKAEVLSMSKKHRDLDNGIKMMKKFNNQDNGVKTNITFNSTRPVWEQKAGTFKLINIAEKLYGKLSQPFIHECAGGGSIGNFTSAMGIPTLDGLGVSGDKIHTLEEHLEIQSLDTRIKLMAGLVLLIGVDF